jgi:hypothetical protein
VVPCMPPGGPRPALGPGAWARLLALGTPFLAAAAAAAGRGERALFAAAFAATEARALQGTAAPGGGVFLALLPVALDVGAVALALAALQRGLARRRHHEGGFPWTALCLLGDANALCAGCSLALATVTLWGCVLGMFLWIVQSGD